MTHRVMTYDAEFVLKVVFSCKIICMFYNVAFIIDSCDHVYSLIYLLIFYYQNEMIEQSIQILFHSLLSEFFATGCYLL